MAMKNSCSNIFTLEVAPGASASPPLPSPSYNPVDFFTTVILFGSVVLQIHWPCWPVDSYPGHAQCCVIKDVA